MYALIVEGRTRRTRRTRRTGGTTLVPVGLARAPDGSRIFAVTETSGTSSLSPHVLDHLRTDDPVAGEGTLIGSADGTSSSTDRPTAKGQVQCTAQYYGDTRRAYGSVVVEVVSD
ncbi:hypothetical protein ACFUAC_20640 [Streptomyces sp. NPDC057148]|uniref:hypothetical protein n=1 Tax=unclassified Streptomyces TaxID=2593676 RepID=UPI003632B704